jgi:2-methylcitrate dehydratase PrpD
MEVTARLSEYAATLHPSHIPPEALAQAKLCVLDLVGIMVRACLDAESSPPIRRAVLRLGGDGEGPCSAVGQARGTGAPLAALLNGAYGHSLDFDDTHQLASLHPGVCVIPAALAVGELTGADGPTLLAAIVAGYDVTCRLGLAVDPESHYARGFHPTATCGVFGAAAAAGRLLGLDAARMAAALGLAGSLAAGSLQYLENGSWNKRLQPGFAAAGGIQSAILAEEGVVGAAQAVEGRLGFLHAYTDAPHPERALEGLGTRFEVTRTALKPYPCCRYAHSAIDGIRGLFAGDIAPEDVERLEVGLNESGMRLIGAPEERKRNPANVVDGQFSLHFVGAVAALHGRMGWDDYRYLGDPRVRAFSERIRAIPDPGVRGVGCTITARLRDGRVVRRAIATPKGEPELPLSPDEVRAKFMDLAGVWPGAAETAARILDLESLPDVRILTRALRTVA